MRIFQGTMKVALLLTVMVALFDVAHAQQARTFGNKVPIVRLCPATCTAVNGHGLKAGSKTTVFETRSGWARVSAYLNRAQLVASFGDSTPPKPALWVPVSSLKSAAAAAPAKKKQTTAAKPKPKRANVVAQIARLRSPALPSFRPNSRFAKRAETSEPIVETPAVETPAPTQVVETPAPVVEVETPVVAEVKPKAIVNVDDTSGTRKALSWEEVQALIKKQEGRIGERKVVAAPAAPAKTDANAAAEAQAKKAKEQAVKEAAAKAQREAEAKKAREEQERLNAAAEEKRKKDAEKSAAAAAAAQAERQKQAAAKQKADEAAAKAAADKVAKAKTVDKDADKVGYKPPSATENGTVALGTDGKAVTLPPVAKSVVREAAPAAEAEKPAAETSQQVAVAAIKKPSGPEPTFESAKADPISFGARPKTLTKKLLDKRLNKLPGRKSKVRKDAVIALRHYALGLLNSGECSGIAGGGPSTTPGMLYVACSDDPSYLRQFPMEEESW